MARKAWRIARGIVIFAGLLGAKNVGGTSGIPKKEVVGLGAGEFEDLCAAGKKPVNWSRFVEEDQREVV
jgi:hypothetical protein